MSVFTERLSRDEVEVLALVAQGYENKDIGEKRGTSWRTAQTQVSSICGKLGARNRTQAVYIAYKRGYLRPDEPETAEQAAALTARYAVLTAELLEQDR